MVKPSTLVTEGNLNEALRNALAESGLTQLDLATRLSVDPKTVDKWLAGRTPHPRTRSALAQLVGRAENELWPSIAIPKHRDNSNNEIRAVYPHRWAVPRDVWRQLFQQAERQIDILVYSGLFLAEDAGIIYVLSERAQAGVIIRILLGDPDCPAVAQRGIDEGLGDSMAERIRSTLVLFQSLTKLDGVEVRLHRTTLYNSIYRADDELLVNPHILGVPAPNAPVLRLCRSPIGSMAVPYIDSFNLVWETAA
jgi:transcriptional regulator with XRE-family HTH domain